MGSRGGLGDLAPSAEARIGLQTVDCLLIGLQPSGLPARLPIEIQAEGGQVGDLACRDARGRTDPESVQVLDSQQETTSCAASEHRG